MRRTLLTFCSLLCLAIPAAAQFHFNLRFPSLEEEKQLILQEDHHLKGLGSFDLAARVGKAGATRQELNALLQSECRAWTQAQEDTLRKTFALLEEKIREGGYHLPVCPEIILIKTTMKEEGDAGAYTRANQIYVGESYFQPRRMRDGSERPVPSAASLCTLMAHELFHVLTRNSRPFKEAMYKIIGFTLLDGEIDFPTDILEKRISNPDVSCYDSYATFQVDGKPLRCTMMITANKPFTGGSFFNYLQIGLIPLDGQNKPVVSSGKTVMVPLEKASDFYKKVGRNTGYVINPEECLADNFAIALCGFQPTPRMQSLPNPEITDRMHEVMKQN